MILSVFFPKRFSQPSPNIHYVSMPVKYPWLKYLSENGGIIQIYAPKFLQALMLPESVVLLDEAGIFLNAREFRKLSVKFLNDLAQSRKQGTDMYWAAQFDEQVDKQFRMLTQFFVHCSSLSVYSARLARPVMRWKKIVFFTASRYFDWIRDPRNQRKALRTRIGFSSKVESGRLTKEDKMIFEIYSSFDRLDEDSFLISHLKKYRDRDRIFEPDIVTLWKCDLRSNYYSRKMGLAYSPYIDPFSPFYSPHLFRSLYGELPRYDFTNSSVGFEVISNLRKFKRSSNSRKLGAKL